MRLRTVAALWLTAALWSTPALAQHRFDVGLLGGWASATREGAVLEFDQSTTYQATLGWPVRRSGKVTLSIELPLFATPALGVKTPGSALPKEYASLFLTPGLRVSVFDTRRVVLFGTVGAGYARYSESRERVDKSPNPEQRDTNTGAFALGAGLEVRDGWLGVRAEVRDVFTGPRQFSVAPPGPRVHNLLMSLGFAVRF